MRCWRSPRKNWRPRSWLTSCGLSGLSARIPSARRLEKIRFNDTARLSHRLRPRHLVSRHMGRDGTSTLAVAPRDHYCGGGGIGHCRVVSESSAIKPSILVASLANDLAASLFSRAPTGFVGATRLERVVRGANLRPNCEALTFDGIGHRVEPGKARRDADTTTRRLKSGLGNMLDAKKHLRYRPSWNPVTNAP